MLRLNDVCEVFSRPPRETREKGSMKASRLRRNASALVLTSTLAFFVGHTIHALEQGSAADEGYQLEDSNSLLGSYLAGRVARNQRDNTTAARYYREALDRDPASKEIL